MLCGMVRDRHLLPSPPLHMRPMQSDAADTSLHSGSVHAGCCTAVPAPARGPILTASNEPTAKRQPPHTPLWSSTQLNMSCTTTKRQAAEEASSAACFGMRNCSRRYYDRQDLQTFQADKRKARTMFALPSHVRAIIWRRARFLMALDNLLPRFVSRPVSWLDRALTAGPYDVVRVRLDIPGDKYIIMDRMIFHQGYFADSYCVLRDKFTCRLPVRWDVVRLVYHCSKIIESSWCDTFQNGWVNLQP